jgi:hypothetical protein
VLFSQNEVEPPGMIPSFVITSQSFTLERGAIAPTPY